MKRLVTVSMLILFIALMLMPVTAQEESNEPPWWNDVVWYQIFVRSFYDSDGDGIGDIQGIIEKLDYLNDGDPNTDTDLGITGIKLMPIHNAVSYHGYDVIDYRSIHPDFGTLDDFAQLVEEAHARGIRIIIDFVVNHTSVQNEWFVRSEAGDPEYIDWFTWADEDPGFAGPWGDRAWHQENGRYYYGVFCCGMPDLNYENPAVTAEMFDVAAFWLDDMNVDGFRLDAIKYVIEEDGLLQNSPANRRWLSTLNDYIKQLRPDALTVGEVLDTTITVARYIADDSVDVAFEFDLAEDIISSVLSRNSRTVARMIDRGLENYPPGRYSPFLSNHDQTRIMTQFQGDVGRNKAAATILLSLPGSPFIYYGEEIGMEGAKPDIRLRTPMHWDNSPITAGFTTADEPWEPLTDLGDANLNANVADQIDDPESLLSHYRSLIHLRNAHPALRSTDYMVLDGLPRPIFAYLRFAGEETLLVVVNLSGDEVTDYTLRLNDSDLNTGISRANIIFATDDTSEAIAPAVLEDGGFEDYVPVPVIAPYGSYIISLN